VNDDASSWSVFGRGEEPRGHPTGGAVSLLRKGAIRPASRWVIESWMGRWTVTLDSGPKGAGPMHVYVDGQQVLTFPKPGEQNPWICSDPIALGGKEVVIYAESPNHGDLVNVDLYVDGVSLTTGHGLSDTRYHGAIAAARSRSFVGSMEPAGFIRDSIWGAPLVGVPAILFQTHADLPAKAIAAIACIALTAAVALVGRRALPASKRRPSAGVARQRLIVAMVWTADIAVILALLIPLWGAGR